MGSSLKLILLQGASEEEGMGLEHSLGRRLRINTQIVITYASSATPQLPAL